jgi:hypothetical protein
VVFVVGTYETTLKEAQTICCFIPPLALQIVSGAFLDSYDGLSVKTICGIMVSDKLLAPVYCFKFSIAIPLYHSLQTFSFIQLWHGTFPKCGLRKWV